MKLLIGSRPGASQVSAPTGQSNCGAASAGVSATPSPMVEQPPSKVCSSISQWPDLVRQGVTEGVLACGPSGHGLVEDHDAVLGATGTPVVRPWEVRPAEESVADVGGVDVERLGVTLVQG
ncbi:hypothetical protein [Nocardioides sp.]|jgi:hypothetical protein|uniref:hypothetical protein n=1 Tax=Nocardioides sp. TaxID=35761 RepID=UPI0026144E12|nr:hypothetical protein [Nocardioides sp.]